MATAFGRDVILNLMQDVAELKENELAAVEHLEAMVKLARANSKRLERIARGLNVLATKMVDHEDRIKALEAAQ